MAQRFPRISLDWLTGSAVAATEVHAPDGEVAGQAFLFPAELGHALFEMVQLPYGCGFWRGTQRFLPEASGQLIPLGEYNIDYGEPTFTVQTVRGGRHCHRDLMPEKTLIFEEGRDLFSHLERRRAIPMPDGSFDSVTVAVTIHVRSLAALLGEAESAMLLDSLGIAAIPSVASRIMPRSLAGILHGAMTKSLVGSARKLYLQAKILEYLAALSDHLQSGAGPPPRCPVSRERVRALHAHLLGLEGKVPALEELARKFGVPARRLNDEFKLEYGDSIAAFLAGQRLGQARVALQETDLPIKVLSDRLGYSNVNHFSNAFRRRFGVSPGSLRRTSTTPET